MQPSSKPGSDLVSQLRVIRSRRRLKHWPFVAVLALGVALVTLRFCVQSFVGSTVEVALILVIGIGLIPAVLFSFISVLHLRCPQCHDFFHCGANPRVSEFTQACRHCGLRLDGKNAVMGSNTSLERTRGE